MMMMMMMMMIMMMVPRDPLPSVRESKGYQQSPFPSLPRVETTGQNTMYTVPDTIVDLMSDHRRSGPAPMTSHVSSYQVRDTGRVMSGAACGRWLLEAGNCGIVEMRSLGPWFCSNQTTKHSGR